MNCGFENVITFRQIAQQVHAIRLSSPQSVQVSISQRVNVFRSSECDCHYLDFVCVFQRICKFLRHHASNTANDVRRGNRRHEHGLPRFSGQGTKSSHFVIFCLSLHPRSSSLVLSRFAVVVSFSRLLTLQDDHHETEFQIFDLFEHQRVAERCFVKSSLLFTSVLLLPLVESFCCVLSCRPPVAILAQAISIQDM